MGKGKKIIVLSLLLIFLGYCGDNQDNKSASWLTTDNTNVEGLNVPAALFANCISSGQIQLSWEPFETTATELVIERKAPAQDYVKVGEVDPTTGLFVDSVTNGITYKYRIRAVIMSGETIQYVSEDYSPAAATAATNHCELVVVDVPISMPTSG